MMKQAWVIGDGGIGNALCHHLKREQYQVSILSRSHGTDPLDPNIIHHMIHQKTKLPDLVINTCGILHDETHMPEKSLKQLTPTWLAKSIEVNVWITVNLAQVFSEYLSSTDVLQFCAFSARVSSISDNQLGGWYSYRMSKAMLNMLIKNIAIEWHIKSPSSIIFGYHPGTVDTALSKPFQKNILPNQLFSPSKAAAYCMRILLDNQLDKHGKLIDWQGIEIMP